jgi:hypothetical protein
MLLLLWRVGWVLGKDNAPPEWSNLFVLTSMRSGVVVMTTSIIWLLGAAL